MLTVKDHNERAAALYASISGKHWIQALKDGRHVLIRPLREQDRQREYDFIMRLSPGPGTCASWRRSMSQARRCSIN